jgi:hypothetical protein
MNAGLPVQRDAMMNRPNGGCEQTHYHVVPARDEGWEVMVERAPGVVSSTYCSDWLRVERICAALKQQSRETSAADGKDRQ